jgi:hypothetical protein
MPGACRSASATAAENLGTPAHATAVLLRIRHNGLRRHPEIGDIIHARLQFEVLHGGSQFDENFFLRVADGYGDTGGLIEGRRIIHGILGKIRN